MNNEQTDTGRFWKRVLAGLFVLFVAAMALSFVIAGRKVSKVVDTEYYSHGLHYGEARDRDRAAAAGWRMTAALSRGRLQLQVRDAAGTPLSGGTAIFEVQTGDSGKNDTLVLVETNPGIYSAPQPAGAWSELRGTMRVSRGANALQERMVIFN